MITTIIVVSVIIFFIFVGINLERLREAQSQLKVDKKIIYVRNKTEKDLEKIIDDVDSGNLSNNDIGQLLSSYKKN